MPLVNDFEAQLKLQPCSTCRANRNIRKCPGHTLGNEGSDNSDIDATAKDTPSTKNYVGTKKPDPTLRLDNSSLANFLRVTHDKESEIFTVTLDHPQLTPAQRTHYIKTILDAWQEFRQIHNLSGNAFDPKIITDALGNTTITLLVPRELFGQFIQMLAAKQLLGEEQAKALQSQNQLHIENMRRSFSCMTTPLERMLNPARTPRPEVK
ncbi:MAG: hypothetical protein SFW07_08265 [Gammaproteobacteria bacterium]|nr:hypothetical protein [Gammaproteobacteria bacterium]